MSTTMLNAASNQFAQYSTFVQLSVLVGGGILLYSVYTLYTMGERQAGMPPGPPTIPFFGNALIFPRGKPHLRFSEWAREYGDVVSVKVFKQPVIILNSPTAVREAIEKNGKVTANRPKSTIAEMITPNDMNIGTGRTTGETWKLLRKLAVQSVNNENMKKNRNLQRAEAVQLMWDFCHDPKNWYESISRFTTSFTMAMVYGSRRTSFRSKDIADFLYAQRLFLNALEFGTAPPVDIFPILKWVPERWAGWKKNANQVRELHEELYERFLGKVEKRMEKGLLTGAFIEEALLNSKDLGDKKRDLIMHISGTLLEGSDTSSATLQGIVLCLVAFPEEQKKLRAEIDRVVGNQRVPQWEDIAKLPYLTAFIEEALRFRPVSNLALPHEMVEDAVIDGYLYPKDSVVLMNTRFIYHDERYFEDAEGFHPERFIKHPLGVRPDVEDDPARRPNMIFGGGRRICPGITFAKTSMEITTALLVWAFEFLPQVDPKTGKELFPDLDNYASGITATPAPHPIHIKPRSQNHIELIQKEFTSIAEHLIPFEHDLPEEDRQFNVQHRDI